MGARPSQIMRIILTEAAAITVLGGLFGLGFGASLVLVFARTLGFYFETIGVPFAWPPVGRRSWRRQWRCILRASRHRRRVRACLAGGSSGAIRPSQSGGGALILHAANLRKSYATGVVAVSHAELKFDDSEFISIVGRSGSGKSTLLAMIGALSGRPRAR